MSHILSSDETHRPGNPEAFTYCYTVLSVPCNIEVTCSEGADLLALLCVTFSSVFVTFPCDVLGQVWYLIVSIPYLYLHLTSSDSDQSVSTERLRPSSSMNDCEERASYMRCEEGILLMSM